jgi:hypothetical protein
VNTTALLAPPSPAPARVQPDDYPPVNVRGITLRGTPDAVALGARTARRFTRDYCDSRGIRESVRDDAVLCVSEIAGNVRHALFPAGRVFYFVQLRQLGPFLSVRVFDPDWQHLPCLREAGAGLAVGGRGLSLIVAPLSCRLTFGVSPRGLKVVEFILDCLPGGGL